MPEYVPDQNIWQCSRKKQMHCTSIVRLLSIAAGHPLVSEAEDVDKARASLQQDKENGRATQGHQSGFNIRIILKASGAIMMVGLTAHMTDKSLLAPWWKPGKGCCTGRMQFAIAESIFYDIAETEHKIPLFSRI